MANTIRVATIDSEPIFHHGIVAAFAGTDVALVANGRTVDDAFQIIKSHMPDILLLDIRMAQGGYVAVEDVARHCGATKLIILTSVDDEEQVTGALYAGARGYVLKSVSGPELVCAIETVHHGHSYVTGALASRLLTQFAGKIVQGPNGKKAPPTFDEFGLTLRQAEVCRCLARGMSNQQIGCELDLDVRTVKHHLTHIFKKLDVRNRTEAVVKLNGGVEQFDFSAQSAVAIRVLLGIGAGAYPMIDRSAGLAELLVGV